MPSPWVTRALNGELPPRVTYTLTRFTLDVWRTTSGDAEYSDRITVDAYDLDQAIDIAIERDPSTYHVSHEGRAVWAANGIDL